jgi:hypothetical protein
VVNQTQNVGDGKYYGFEFSIDSTVTDTLQAGVRYTYVNRNIDCAESRQSSAAYELAPHGLPYSQLFAMSPGGDAGAQHHAQHRARERPLVESERQRQRLP